MEIIERPAYLERIISRLNRGMILILTGQRRVGKSYVLLQLQRWLQAAHPAANVLYINKELQEFRALTTASELYDYVAERMPSGGDNYLLIDEVQDVTDYQNALRSLQAEERCQIVATGSNAYVFSSEISTRLAGRYIEIPVYSLSYQEFLTFHHLDDSDASLLSYLRVGGLPGLRHFDIADESQVRDYLQGVYTTVMMRDVVSREQVRNVTFVENLSHFIADNIGKPISVLNIANTIKAQGGKETATLTSTYLKYLCNALIINQVNRYDVRGKRLFEQNFKYYFADHGLRNYLCGFNLRASIEKVIENVIYNHLRRRGFTVAVGILRAGEIDFVATRGSDTIYVQAAYLLANESTIQREFGNLTKIGDSFPKYVVSMDSLPGSPADFPGIRAVALRHFLQLDL